MNINLLFKYWTYPLKVKHKLLCAYFSVVVHKFRFLNLTPSGAMTVCVTRSFVNVFSTITVISLPGLAWGTGRAIPP